jgi:hypothetical protein
MTSSRHTDRGAPEGSGNRTELCLEVPTGCLQPFRGGCPRPSYPGRFHTVEATADSGQAGLIGTYYGVVPARGGALTTGVVVSPPATSFYKGGQVQVTV